MLASCVEADDMTDERQQDTRSRLTESRRRVPAAAAPAPIATGVPARARALSAGPGDGALVEPVMTKLTDRAYVGESLGRPGGMKRFGDAVVTDRELQHFCDDL
jgi:hypothetical protein